MRQRFTWIYPQLFAMLLNLSGQLSPLPPLLLQNLRQQWCLTSELRRSVIAAKRFLSSYWRRHSSLYLKALPEVDQVSGRGERHGSLGAGVLEQRREQLPERRQVGGLLLDMQESTGYKTQAFTSSPRGRVDHFYLFDYQPKTYIQVEYKTPVLSLNFRSFFKLLLNI